MDEEILEFQTEANDLIDLMETSLMEFTRNTSFDEVYNPIFRALHSLKGGAGMLGLNDLVNLAHHLEDLFIVTKETKTIPDQLLDYLLKGCDGCRNLLEGKESGVELINPGIPPLSNSKDSSISETTEVDLSDKDRESLSNRLKILKESDNRPIIFVIDDEKPIRDMILTYLENENYRLIEFSDGEEAIKSLTRFNPSLIITDLNMPKVSGMELISIVNKKYFSLPIILISGYLDVKLCTQAMTSGAGGIVEKPFQENHLLEIVKVTMGRYQSFKDLLSGINHLMYQFSDIEEVLNLRGQSDVLEWLRLTMDEIWTIKKDCINPKGI